MATKETKKVDKVSDKTKKVIKREPTPAAILKKVASVSDSSKALQKEIKVMSKIFGDNQKVLVSMKDMIDALTSTLENIQKQSKQIDILEDDTQKLYAGLNLPFPDFCFADAGIRSAERIPGKIRPFSELQKSSP